MGPAALRTAFVAAILPIAPTEPTLVAVGTLAAVLHESPLDVIIVAGLGCCLSDHMFYAIGRWGGTRLLDRLSARPAIGRATAWLVDAADQRGIPVFVAARWLPAGGTAGAVLAGTLHWPLRRFTPASLTGSLLWTTYATLLGYLGGAVTGSPLSGTRSSAWRTESVWSLPPPGSLRRPGTAQWPGADRNAWSARSPG